MKPKLQTKAQLLDLLERLATAIDEDDSFEGSLEYEIAPGQMFKVQAFFRVGNSQGQGGSIIVGEDD